MDTRYQGLVAQIELLKQAADTPEIQPMIESAARRLAHELVNRREAINRELSRNGVRFGIYKNGALV